MNTKHILLVDDDPCDVEMIRAALNVDHLAFKVVAVQDGEEALDYLHCRGPFHQRDTGNPIVVLLDNKMPKVSGLEVLKIIKADEQLKTIPIVALTSSREPRDLIEFYKHGVNAYVVKPVSYPEFTTAVKQLGIFWGQINQLPTGAEQSSIQNGDSISTEKKKTGNEIPTPHPALVA